MYNHRKLTAYHECTFLHSVKANALVWEFLSFAQRASPALTEQDPEQGEWGKSPPWGSSGRADWAPLPLHTAQHRRILPGSGELCCSVLCTQRQQLLKAQTADGMKSTKPWVRSGWANPGSGNHGQLPLWANYPWADQSQCTGVGRGSLLLRAELPWCSWARKKLSSDSCKVQLLLMYRPILTYNSTEDLPWAQPKGTPCLNTADTTTEKGLGNNCDGLCSWVGYKEKPPLLIKNFFKMRTGWRTSLTLSQQSHGMEKEQDKDLPPYKEHSLKISESFKDERRVAGWLIWSKCPTSAMLSARYCLHSEYLLWD